MTFSRQSFIRFSFNVLCSRSVFMILLMVFFFTSSLLLALRFITWLLSIFKVFISNHKLAIFRNNKYLRWRTRTKQLSSTEFINCLVAVLSWKIEEERNGGLLETLKRKRAGVYRSFMDILTNISM